MANRSLISPKRLLAYYRAGKITRAQWLAGMQLQFQLALQEIAEDRRHPKRANLESWRCKSAARRLLKDNNETEIREVMVALSDIDDFPPSTYLWNADQRDIPLYCFLRERREPVLRFKELNISRTRASLIIEYGQQSAKHRVRESITLRRDWRGTLIVESRE
ncbi:hypothetical protein HW115_08040 [Verrucomicrobiaceae bacterium N1E253]|uniref:Uncharacterized protein n=1 Tax=Oceaniferula marina TaxID=2748318 RepID=A0A851GCT5_9BACT|nr:hypothetical protein [Oceaniferula marina]NWK55558.1 hypothetical protein [Oceaniferula marina]